MNNLAAVIVPPVVPYYGYYGGVNIGCLTTGGIIGLMVVVTLLLAMVCVVVYTLNKEEFLNKEESSMFEKYGVDTEMRIMTILIDILAVVTIIAGGFFYYICIDELISRF